MKRGTYLKCFKVFNIYFKISFPKSPVERYIYNKFNDVSIRKYVDDINSLGIKTSKLYFTFSIKSKIFIAQKYIRGLTLDEYVNKTEYTSESKEYFEKLMLMFKKSLISNDFKIDWNLNNFIINDGLVLVDYMPPLYIDVIKTLDDEHVSQLRQLYLTPTIQLQGIVGYWLRPYMNLEKDAFMHIYNELLSTIKRITEIDLMNEISNDHVFSERLSLIQQCLGKHIDYEAMKKQYMSISLKKLLDEYNRS